MRFLGAILGLLSGVVAGVVLVAWNPLTWSRNLSPLDSDAAPRRAYSDDNFRGIDGSIDDLLGLGQKKEPKDSRSGRGPLPGTTLSGVRIGIVRLPSGAGSPAALAVKVSTIDAGNSLWLGQLGTDDYWNVFWPGEGSVFAAGYGNSWSIIRNRLLAFVGIPPADRGSANDQALSAPPPAGMWTGVIGASGRYTGYVGEIREWQAGVAGDQQRSVAIKVVPPPVVSP